MMEDMLKIMHASTQLARHDQATSGREPLALASPGASSLLSVKAKQTDPRQTRQPQGLGGGNRHLQGHHHSGDLMCP
jgi:hypothetical protein